MKVQKIIVLLIICLSLFGCSYNYNKDIKQNSILIDKITLDMEYKISSINEEIREVVMFEECGRPDIEGTNTVIGAHSGSADYAYFNQLYLLEIGDIIKLVYNNHTYAYEVNEIKEVKDTEVDILENKNKSILTLLTCKLGDSTKRLIVIGNLINEKN